MRAAFFTLIHAGASVDLPSVVIEVVEAINRSECEAIYTQCQAGPTSSSSIFHDEIVSEESIPAGLFVMVLGIIIKRVHARGGNTESVRNCVTALHSSMPFVLKTITLPCPEPADGKFVDPRPAVRLFSLFPRALVW